MKLPHEKPEEFGIMNDQKKTFTNFIKNSRDYFSTRSFAAAENCKSTFRKLSITLLFLFAFAAGLQAQSTIKFNNTPSLISGTALTQGAKYRFPNVAPGADAIVTITTISNATLVELDANSVFPDRFEPTIRTTGVNQEGYVRFDFELVFAGTTTPKIVPAVTISTQDIDGNGAKNQIREWVEFVNTGPVTTGNPTLLVPGTPVAGGVRYNQSDSLNNQASIGTDDRYELYTTILGSTNIFTIIGGNITGRAGCMGDSCDRQNSYAFDPTSAKQTPPAPDVSITKAGPSTVALNGTVTYTLVGRNLGPTSAHGAIINDNVPASLTNVTITCTATNGAVCPSTSGFTTLNNTYIPTFPVNGTVTFTISGTASTAGTITNTANIQPPSGSTDPIPTNNTSQTITTTVASPPNVGLVKSCPTPANCTTAPQMPNTELTYKIDFSNTGGSNASGLVIVDGIPANTDYKLTTANTNVGTTGMTFTIEFSNNYDANNPTAATWTYTPVSGAGGANAGYDRLVKAIRWRVTAGSLPFTSPNNNGNIGFIVKIR
ncbi:MAG: hypothetical protein ACR2J3_01145 [Aridibacter sp.]